MAFVLSNLLPGLHPDAHSHILLKIVNSSASTLAEMTKYRRISKSWQAFMDHEFFEKPRFQSMLESEKVYHGWLKGNPEKEILSSHRVPNMESVIQSIRSQRFVEIDKDTFVYV